MRSAEDDLALGLANAVYADLLGTAPREYYGSIENGGDGRDICDGSGFLSDDADRLLNGSFTVLGKVSTAAEDEVPLLSRNKLLSLLGVGFVDDALADLPEATSEGGANFPDDREDAIDKVLDAALDSVLHPM